MSSVITMETDDQFSSRQIMELNTLEPNFKFKPLSHTAVRIQKVLIYTPAKIIIIFKQEYEVAYILFKKQTMNKYLYLSYLP
jgi:hypothetical protein